MPKRKMWVEYPDGSELSKSRKSPGDSSPLTREEGTNRLGHVTLSDIDESEEDSLWMSPDTYGDRGGSESQELSENEKLAAEVLTTLLFIGVAKAAPHAKSWWSNSARPTIASTAAATRDRVARVRKRNRQTAAAEPTSSVEAVHVAPSRALNVTPNDDEVVMSSEEASQRLVAALMAKALSDQAKEFSDEQLRVLLNARIEDVPASRASLANLTPHEVETRINLMLEANPSLIGELEKLFWANRNTANQQVLLTSEEVRESLPPPRLHS